MISLSRIKYRALILVNGLWAIPIVVLVRLVSNVRHYRFGTLETMRIGHFTMDAMEHILRQELETSSSTDFFWWDDVSNQQWNRMIKGSLRVSTWAKYPALWNLVIPGGVRNTFTPSLTGTRDIEGLLSRSMTRPSFTQEEESSAKAWLRSNGWSDGEPFVCLLVRDSAYLGGAAEEKTGQSITYRDWSYHDYRDSDVETFIPMIEWLVGKSVWVLRMGRTMRQPVRVQSNRFIDYAFDEAASDLLDVWLFANCTACISTSSGPDNISLIYGKPMLCVNAMPLNVFVSYAECTWVPKHLERISDSRRLGAVEQLDHSFMRTSEYSSAGLRIVPLSSNEILRSAQEFWDCHIREPASTPPNEVLLQNKFRELLQDNPRSRAYHGYLHPRARVASWWLEEEGLIFDTEVDTSPD